MKFSGYQSSAKLEVAAPRVTAPGNPLAYGMNGNEWKQAGQAVEKIGAVLQKKQDESDEQDLLDARNKIMTSLTQQMYNSDNGFFTTGYGENAKGLTDRVTDAVHTTFDNVLAGYNGRVQKAARKTLKDNIDNFQRLAASRESTEAVKLRNANIEAGINNGAQLCGLNYNNQDMISTQLKEGRRLVDALRVSMGLSGEAAEIKARQMNTEYISAAVKAAYDAKDYARAGQLLNDYKKDMDQKSWNQLHETVNTQERKLELYKTAENIYAQCEGDIQVARALATEAATTKTGEGENAKESIDVDKIDKIMVRVNARLAEDKRAEREARGSARAARGRAVEELPSAEDVEVYISEHEEELDEGEKYQLRRQAENRARAAESYRNGYKLKNAESDLTRLQVFGLKNTQGDNISASEWVNVTKAAQRLRSSGMLPVDLEDEIADVTGREGFYSKFTDDVDRYGYLGARERLINTGKVSQLAADIIITEIYDDYKVTKVSNLPEDNQEDESENSD